MIENYNLFNILAFSYLGKYKRRTDSRIVQLVAFFFLFLLTVPFPIVTSKVTNNNIFKWMWYGFIHQSQFRFEKRSNHLVKLAGTSLARHFVNE